MTTYSLTCGFPKMWDWELNSTESEWMVDTFKIHTHIQSLWNDNLRKTKSWMAWHTSSRAECFFMLSLFPHKSSAAERRWMRRTLATRASQRGFLNTRRRTHNDAPDVLVVLTMLHCSYITLLRNWYSSHLMLALTYRSLILVNHR